MSTPIIVAQVHRFHGKVAVSVGNGSTTYLTPAEACALARSLRECAEDIGAHSFGDSHFGTNVVELDTSI